ncbi:hypothetical protein [Stagnihabitans tardus]|uniref:site-specific DNA-methyltransferase (cytosine-N(4)-specific) n=1 Tax=Stagnihabitans tardus TaxID=2699202 RepID=A0AAE4YGD8_9RHOB|nr:hypothetical protein [Stagnihabitans tardus]NBZ89250.1 hypothetical protein [Stagnihabitans tardus]
MKSKESTELESVPISITRNAETVSPDITLETLVSEFAKHGKPIEVNFRELSPIKPGEDRYTHLVHSYPAKLLPNIPAFFLGCEALAAQGQLVYDPFCGTGTVLVEGMVSGMRLAGADSNPLARLITRAKTTWLPEAFLEEQLETVLRIAAATEPTMFSPVVSVERWFTESAADGLGRIRSAIEKATSDQARTFFLVCLSQIVRRCSLADPRLSVPVRVKEEPATPPRPIDLFEKVARQNILRVSSLPIGCTQAQIHRDARIPIGQDEEPTSLADLVITSPPYAGAQKYIRASSLNIGWLALAPTKKLRDLEKLNIGREHHSAAEIPSTYSALPLDIQNEIERISLQNGERAHIFGIYMLEMQTAVQAIRKSLKIGCCAVLVMGDNQICGKPVHTSRYIRNLFALSGFTVELEIVDHIKSRGLMTKRNKTAGLISHEHVFILRREK